MTDPTTPQQPSESASGFFAALFDFSFSSFIALKFIKVIYIIAIVLIGLGAVGFFFTSLAADQGLVAFLTLIFAFFYLISVRIGLEVIALLFRIGEDAKAIRQNLTNS